VMTEAQPESAPVRHGEIVARAPETAAFGLPRPSNRPRRRERATSILPDTSNLETAPCASRTKSLPCMSTWPGLPPPVVPGRRGKIQVLAGFLMRIIVGQSPRTPSDLRFVLSRSLAMAASVTMGFFDAVPPR
jgi:hypothetical protein